MNRRTVMSRQLIHGDCLEEMKKIPDGSVDLVLTDPPYGTTACKWDTIIPFEPMWEQLKRVTKKNGAIVLFGSQPFTSALVMSNPKMFSYEWIWDKVLPSGFQNSRNLPMKRHENICVFYETKPSYNPQMTERDKPRKSIQPKTQSLSNRMTSTKLSDTSWTLTHRFPVSIIAHSNADRNKARHFHPTQKPVALMEYLIKTYTNENETVLDFTMGSGTTGVACKNLNRNFIGIELDKDYFEIAKKRIEETPERLL